MMTKGDRAQSILMAAVALLLAAVPAQAQKAPYCPVDHDGRVASVFYEGSIVWFEPLVEHERLVLTVVTPCSTVVREFARGKNPFFDVSEVAGELDGTYSWELRVVPVVDPGVRSELEKSRNGGDPLTALRLQEKGYLPTGPLVDSASFTVVEGRIVPPDEGEEGGGGEKSMLGVTAGRSGPMTPMTLAGELRPTTAADQVIPDDLIVQGSACVGFDCVNNESFGFDTIRLKENNTRIQFNDTSSTASYPTNNWQIRANSSANGGASFLGFLDQNSSDTSETGTLVFAVEADAGANALYVDSTGRVGFGTSTPVLDLHVSSSNTPALRLEQTSAGGFTAQTWDVAGNEANFFVRDVTGGSRLSFRIRPGAPTSSIDISADGDVGIGTASPDAKLHVEGSDGGTDLLVEETNGTAATRTLITAKNRGQTRFVIHNTNAATPVGGGYFFAHFDNGSFVIRPSGGGVGLVMDASGNVTTEGNLTVNGTFANPSSRQLKEAFAAVDPAAILERFVQLPISEWSYRNDQRELRHVGPTVEDFQAAFGLGTDGVYMYPIDVQGVTMAAVQGLHGKVAALEGERERLIDEVAELKAMVAALAAAIQK